MRRCLSILIKFKDVEKRKDGSVGYPIKDHQKLLKHIAYRKVTPDNPFGPHKHEGDEIWFIIKGKAKVNIGGVICCCNMKMSPLKI